MTPPPPPPPPTVTHVTEIGELKRATLFFIRSHQNCSLTQPSHTQALRPVILLVHTLLEINLKLPFYCGLRSRKSDETSLQNHFKKITHNIIMTHALSPKKHHRNDRR